MLSLHGIIICSNRGLLAIQKCMLEGYSKSNIWDKYTAQIQPYINAYALRVPLVYQYGKLGGEELYTKIDYKNLNNKIIPDKWINKTNISIITLS